MGAAVDTAQSATTGQTVSMLSLSVAIIFVVFAKVSFFPFVVCFCWWCPLAFRFCLPYLSSFRPLSCFFVRFLFLVEPTFNSLVVVCRARPLPTAKPRLQLRCEPRNPRKRDRLSRYEFVCLCVSRNLCFLEFVGCCCVHVETLSSIVCSV